MPALFQSRKIDNAFVGDQTAFSFKQDRKIPIESFGDVVRVQDRDFCGIV